MTLYKYNGEFLWRLWWLTLSKKSIIVITNPSHVAYHHHLTFTTNHPSDHHHLTSNTYHPSAYNISRAIHAQASASANLSDMLSFTFLSVRLLWAEITCVKLSTAEIKFILELLKWADASPRDAFHEDFGASDRIIFCPMMCTKFYIQTVT